jgi:hypothetical protein
MKKTVFFLIFLVLCIPVIAFAADVSLRKAGVVPGTPFQALQQQIDQLKNQLQNIQLTPGPAGPAGEGAIKVYDANDQFLGIYAGLLPGTGALVAGIFVPKFNLFIQIGLDPRYPDEYGQIPTGGYYGSTTQEGIFIGARDKLVRTCDNKYVTGTGEPTKVNQVYSIFSAESCSSTPFPMGDVLCFATEEISADNLSLFLPKVAMPLKYK